MTEEELEAKSKMGTAPVITKSMKKRQKKQAKATATATAEEEEDEEIKLNKILGGSNPNEEDLKFLLNMLGELGRDLGVEAVIAFK
jgi:hypothetical protein